MTQLRAMATWELVLSGIAAVFAALFAILGKDIYIMFTTTASLLLGIYIGKMLYARPDIISPDSYKYMPDSELEKRRAILREREGKQ